MLLGSNSLQSNSGSTCFSFLLFSLMGSAHLERDPLRVIGHCLTHGWLTGQWTIIHSFIHLLNRSHHRLALEHEITLWDPDAAWLLPTTLPLGNDGLNVETFYTFGVWQSLGLKYIIGCFEWTSVAMQMCLWKTRVFSSIWRRSLPMAVQKLPLHSLFSLTWRDFPGCGCLAPAGCAPGSPSGTRSSRGCHKDVGIRGCAWGWAPPRWVSPGGCAAAAAWWAASGPGRLPLPPAKSRSAAGQDWLMSRIQRRFHREWFWCGSVPGGDAWAAWTMSGRLGRRQVACPGSRRRPRVTQWTQSSRPRRGWRVPTCRDGRRPSPCLRRESGMKLHVALNLLVCSVKQRKLTCPLWACAWPPWGLFPFPTSWCLLAQAGRAAERPRRASTSDASSGFSLQRRELELKGGATGEI